MKILAKSIRRIIKTEMPDMERLQEIRLRTGQPLRIIRENRDIPVPDQGESETISKTTERLLRAIKDEVERLKKEGKYGQLDGVEEISKNHGRIESIKARLIKNTAFLHKNLGLESFYGSIARIGIIEKETNRTGNGGKSSSRQVVITNLETLGIEDLVKIRQGYWNIEMQHWLLDVQLKEDQKTKSYSLRKDMKNKASDFAIALYIFDFKEKPVEFFPRA